MRSSILKHILRSWRDEPSPPPHPLMRILPPFAWELMGYLLGIAILYQVAAYLLS